MEIILRYFSGFTDGQLRQLAALQELYREWNAKINVISRKDIDNLYEKHVLHSLSIAAVADFPKGARILDIGTGGGFPGIPLAVYFPEVQFHLADATGKKIKVVKAVAEALQLENVTAEQIRVEQLKGRTFDFTVSRATAPLKDLCRWSRPLIRKNTQQGPKSGLFCLKGGDLHEEISDSGYRPRLYEISQLFPEPFFREKYLLHVPL